jgi:hypothetical protein
MKQGMRTLLTLPIVALAMAVVSAPAWAGAAPTPETGAQSMEVELVVAAGVQDREPVGEAETFPEDIGQVFAWVRVTDGAGQAVEVVWRHGENTFAVPLEIGGSPWRTWSSKTIPPEWAGPWSVTVRDSDGNTLAEASFTVG